MYSSCYYSVIGAITIVVKLLYFADPSIELTLKSGPVSVEGLAVLICTVSGVTGMHNFTWYHNGRLRLERLEPYISIQHNGNVSMLSIHDIALEEAGNYTCIAHTSNTSTPLQESIILQLQGILKVVETIHVCCTYVHLAGYIIMHACTFNVVCYNLVKQLAS